MKKRITIVVDDKLIEDLHKIQADTILATNSPSSMSSLINGMIKEKLNKKHADISKLVGLTVQVTLLEAFGKKPQTILVKNYTENIKHTFQTILATQVISQIF